MVKNLAIFNYIFSLSRKRYHRLLNLTFTEPFVKLSWETMQEL